VVGGSPSAKPRLHGSGQPTVVTPVPGGYVALVCFTGNSTWCGLGTTKFEYKNGRLLE